MDPFRLIRDPAELSGSQFFELLPGAYNGQCWNAGSVYVEEEVFGYL